MAIRTIVSLPEPVLRRKARPVTSFGGPLQVLIDDMVETMRQAPGVGLAAPQVNVSERVIVVEYAEEEENDTGEVIEKPSKLYVMINPEIVKESEETELGVEGCLSIPGIVGEVERATSIQIKGLNRHGRPTKLKAEGWLARIFQHEIDHLNGVLFPDRATKVWKPETEPAEEQEV